MATGVLETPFREPVNFAQDADGGGIHDDATAQKLGMRGGTVAGSIHMNQFVPLLQKAFGERAWFEQGCLSCYFLSPTVHLEPVKAFVQPAAAAATAASAWMETEDGTKVLEGTASVGIVTGGPASALEARLARNKVPSEPLRILAGLRVGAKSARVPARYDFGKRLPWGNLEWGPAQYELTTEPIPWYIDPSTSPWGARVLPPQHMYNIFNQRQYRRHQPLFPEPPGGGGSGGESVGLLGGVEVSTVGNGPILCDRDYTVEWEVVALGASPKTEISWIRGTLRELDGAEVARSLTMSRVMKASSPMYAKDAKL